MLPNLIIIGAMKCGTSAVHHLLDNHPQIAMSRPKELNFFFGEESTGEAQVRRRGDWQTGRWHRGIGWYARQFPDAAPVRGESSPGYTSPSHPQVAARMAGVVPEARLVYLVRDPVDRALSQYRHHRLDGTERRPMEDALLDPGSQYIARGRYLERLEPFLRHFPAEHILVVAQEELEADPGATMDELCRFAGVSVPSLHAIDPPLHLERERPRSGRCAPAPHLRAHLATAFADDAARFMDWCGRDFPWSL